MPRLFSFAMAAEVLHAAFGMPGYGARGECGAVGWDFAGVAVAVPARARSPQPRTAHHVAEISIRTGAPLCERS
jgi:hypothetical protein